jgi:hypothetical protein
MIMTNLPAGNANVFNQLNGQEVAADAIRVHYCG